MLKAVLFCMDPDAEKTEQERLCSELYRQEIGCIKMSEKEACSLLKSLTEAEIKEMLILTDKECVLCLAKERGGSAAAYDNPVYGGQNLYGGDILLEGLEEVDVSFLIKVYQRGQKLPWTIGETKRLLIREMTVEDLDALYRLYDDPGVLEFLEPLYEEREEEVRYMEAYIKNMYEFYGYGMWALVEKDSGSLIGRAGLNNREIDEEIQIELGYMLGAAYRKKGYALEACREILDFAVKELMCKGVNCFVNKANKSSVRLVERLGFKYLREISVEAENLCWYRWTYVE